MGVDGPFHSPVKPLGHTLGAPGCLHPPPPFCPAGARIAVEVDGPFHYAINAVKPLGHTIGRRRILRAGGWRVVSIPYYDW